MQLARVKGQVVATAKLERLEGKKLLLVEVAAARAEGLEWTGRYLVCVDAVGAGEGELVLVVSGSSARIAEGMKDMPTDAVIVGIVDSLQAFGKGLALEPDTGVEA